jgi:hypothetical protein
MFCDNDMFDELSKYSWRPDKDKYLRTTINTPKTDIEPRKSTTIFAHHLVIGLPAEGFVVHHKNGKRHDNRLINLTFCTIKQNNQWTKYRDKQNLGISQKSGRFQAQVTIVSAGKKDQFSIGVYNSELQAILARQEADRLIDLGWSRKELQSFFKVKTK